MVSLDSPIGCPHPTSTRTSTGASAPRAAWRGPRLERMVGGVGEGGFGEFDVEGRSHTNLALHGDFAAVHLDDLLADGEPEPAAPGSPRAVLVDPVEPVEEVREILRGDAYPGVRDTYRHRVQGLQHVDLHPGAGI